MPAELVLAQAALPVHLHVSALVCAFQHHDRDLVHLLRQFADIRVASATDDQPLVQHLQRTTVLLCAADGVLTASSAQGAEGVTVTSTLLALATKLLDNYCIAEDLSDVYMECTLLLWKVAQPLLDGVVGINDREADTAMQLLRALHTAFDALDYDDYTLRYSAW